jgi:excinuclease ABC subunit C
MIKEYAPKYNVLLRDDKRYLLVKINFSEKFPVLKLARLRKNDGYSYYGPFPKGGALKRTVDFLVRKFGLRTCGSAVPGERERKHCMAGTVRDCCEPCVGKTSEKEYKKRVEALAAVIEGDVAEVVREIRGLMAEEAERCRFEKAAEYRDVIENIETIFGKRNRTFRYAKIPKDKNAEAGLESLKNVLGLPEPPMAIEAFDISNISGSLAVAGMVRFTAGLPDTSKYRRFRIRGEENNGKKGMKRDDGSNIGCQTSNSERRTPDFDDSTSRFDYPMGRGGDDFAMMEEAVFRRYSRISREIGGKDGGDHSTVLQADAVGQMPDLILIDGGKGQLNAAIKALKRAGITAPVIGLAKKNEEIFVPGRQLPIRLDLRDPAVNLLRSIRDEAHRFAVAYHRKLRNSRIEESILDQIPGVGPERKRELLRAFGSLGALRKASAERIAAEVPGIGAKSAAKIAEYLRTGK